jgi:phosphatidylglycerophosphate synthase
MNQSTMLPVLMPYPKEHGGTVQSVQTGPLIGTSALLLLLAVLDGTVGISGWGWLVGVASGLVMTVLLARGLERRAMGGLGPANRITLTRAMLVCVVAAFTTDSFSRPTPMATFLAITVVALVLDAVDGRVARLTGSTSALGARFDMEVDAFLILVLSVYVGRAVGAWVLAIGVARYLFVAARWLVPWMRGTVPPRRWCKVVAAIQGVALTVVAADVLPRPLAMLVIGGSLALLAESFGREVWELRRMDTARPSARKELSAAGVRAHV